MRHFWLFQIKWLIRLTLRHFFICLRETVVDKAKIATLLVVSDKVVDKPIIVRLVFRKGKHFWLFQIRLLNRQTTLGLFFVLFSEKA